jgi:hypothetical protein
MFAHVCDLDTILPLWDHYFLADDPFFVYFLALVMLINAREYVFQLAEDPSTLAVQISSMPSGATEEDVDDMCDLARHYASVTPTSFRADFQSRLFGGGKKGPRPDSSSTSRKEASMYERLCLSVSVDTVLRHTEGAIKFFVVDIRPLAQFDAGHLEYAWHLDATLQMERPAVFAEEVSQLEDALAASDQHPSFLGSGMPNDDIHMSMVVSHFLQRKQKYVSIVKGGFAALHAQLEREKRTTSVLAGHSPTRLLPVEVVEPTVPAPAPVKKSVSSLFGKIKKATKDQAPSKEHEPAKPKSESMFSKRLKGFSAAFKEGLMVAAEATGRTADKFADRSAESMKTLKAKSKKLSEKIKDVAVKGDKKDAGLYRGNDRPMFSIDDEDDSDEGGDSNVSSHARGKGGGSDVDLAGAVIKLSSAGELFVSVAKAKKQPAVRYYFQCSEVSSEGYLFPSHLLLTDTHLIKLRDRNKKGNEAVVLSRRELSRIQKITAKKKHPNILTFLFDAEADVSADAVDATAEVPPPITQVEPTAGALASNSSFDNDDSPRGLIGGDGESEVAGADGEDANGAVSVYEENVGNAAATEAPAVEEPDELAEGALTNTNECESGIGDENAADDAESATRSDADAGGDSDVNEQPRVSEENSTAAAAVPSTVPSDSEASGNRHESDHVGPTEAGSPHDDEASPSKVTKSPPIVSPSGAPLVQERFMVPEARAAKEAFRKLIMATR